MTWGCGRILPQGLNESIICIRMIQALEIVKDELDQDYLDFIYEHLFKEMYLLLKPQVDMIHNIRCWNNSALGLIGFFFHKKKSSILSLKDRTISENKFKKGSRAIISGMRDPFITISSRWKESARFYCSAKFTITISETARKRLNRCLSVPTIMRSAINSCRIPTMVGHRSI